MYFGENLLLLGVIDGQAKFAPSYDWNTARMFNAGGKCMYNTYITPRSIYKFPPPKPQRY